MSDPYGFGPMNTPRNQPQEPVQPPKEVETSFWVWVVGSALSVVTVVLLLLQKDELVRLAVEQYRRGQPQGVDEATVVGVAESFLYGVAVVYVIVAALFVFFAYKMRTGRNWARITLTVLAVIVVLLSFRETTPLGIATLIATVVATVLFYLPNANAYFTGMKRYGR